MRTATPRSLKRLLGTSLALAAMLLAAPASAQAAAPTIELSTRYATAGQTVTARGTGDPFVGVRLEQLTGGTWTGIGPISTPGAGGNWAVSFTARRDVALRARRLDTDESSAIFLRVRPKLIERRMVGTPMPFSTVLTSWRVIPINLTSLASVSVYIDGRRVWWRRTAVRDGRLRLRVPVPGAGRVQVRLLVHDTVLTSPVTSSVTATTPMPALRVGSRGPYVAALHRGLALRRFVTPTGSSYTSRTSDAVVAFHKAWRRTRSGSFAASDWRRLSRMTMVPARSSSSGDHIEIDKSRQLLFKIRDGRVWKVIHVSTGSTGNTPNGTHSILWKGNWVPSFYGGLLYKSMAFRGGFAIHGYPSVPTYPASHGCVRVPMWIAAWLYSESPVGEPVFVYGGGTSRGSAIPEAAARPS